MVLLCAQGMPTAKIADMSFTSDDEAVIDWANVA